MWCVDGMQHTTRNDEGNRKLTCKFSTKDYMLLITVDAQIRVQDAYVNF